MGAVSIRELNSDAAKVMARVEAGEVVEITRDGRIVAEILPRGDSPTRLRPADEQRQRNVARLQELMRRGFDIGGPATYEERTGR